MIGISLLVGLVVSITLSFFLTRIGGNRTRIAGDVDLAGPQKVHMRPVLRIGGMAIVAGMLAHGLVQPTAATETASLFWMLVACAMPVYAAGLCEDLTKAVSPRIRLAMTLLGAGWAFFALDAGILRTGVAAFDAALQWAPLSLLLTVFLVSGLTHAVNIIDGLNGLASMSVMLMLLGLAAVAFSAGDVAMAMTALALMASIFGFFVWNYPRGLIFLGDGGAYFIGFVLAEISVLLIQRNPSVSPWCPILICAYPLVETMFSIYRRGILRKTSPSQADGLHLHTLVYKRLVRRMGAQHARATAQQNSWAALYLWLLCLSAVALGVLFSTSTAACMVAAAAVALAYVFIYRRIVRFQVPSWLVMRRATLAGAVNTPRRR